MSLLNPNTIEFFEIFKGKTAIDRFGDKAANGVILITLKKHVNEPDTAKICQFPQLETEETLDKTQILYILDGKEISFTDLNRLKPQDIESISVLKNQSAIKRYGEKGKNGVIIIHSKNDDASRVTSSDNETPFIIEDLKDNDEILIILDKKEMLYKEFRDKNIDPNTIESISVLKNQPAIKKYGEKGKNGVIIINLKKESQRLKTPKEETIPDYRLRQGNTKA
jgi:TonB-dependent SusC/RagA subfamily outer membrane receptor